MTSSPRSGSSSGKNQPRGGKPRSGAPKSGAPKSGGFKSGAPKSGARKPSQTGARPFKNEQYGRTVKPVNRPTEQNRRPERTTDDIDIHNAEGVRLQKVMAMAGVASRRLCEDMILEGRVQVDGITVTQLGLRVDPDTVEIVVDGMTIQTNDNMVYMVFNKPRGVVSTMEDPEGRPCISDYLKKRQTNERLFHVGRLDTSTEGLLLLTNDGELANRLSHPKYGIPKTYLVQVRGPMAHGVGAQLKDGVELEDGWQKVDSFRLVDSTPGHVLAEVVLHSGKNRIVRRMFDAVGYPVERLVRVKFGPIALGDQRQGSIRMLGRHEVGYLRSDVGM
ncbi:pseudouridine synthase [Arthrobacter stackebrandtii]|uniref:Pseudouridine synthase n=1 Tax=Arthrobacter stackebrandtii TaxID=272161 RepID=A0ABS4Z2R9_9MICC|nr:pseudouridine synthase [Arthrobacter stackebrandtii]MBP2415025.1 pseudouridine synthase [Arthrobacter stackebrandtii]PYH00825.1 pseudouridine synthase [Arthrobacter stackebrandtii]